jgi:hypothetical protein
MTMRALGILPVAGLLLGACGTEPDEPELQGSYSVAYDPARLTSATPNCDRLLTYTILSMNEQGDFDLSFNVIDDCSRGGGGYSYFGVLKLGTYTRHGSELAFTPDSATYPAFTGLIDGEFVRITLPPAIGNLAPVDVDIRAGPRHSY